MKKRILLSCLAAFSFFYASSSTLPTVREQLEGLNKYWKFSQYDDPVLKERTELSSDIELIRMHLRLVEKYLRSNGDASLTPSQKAKRQQSLDALAVYCRNGVFPKNTHHKVRTPYFIDDYGTPCAVGQLIIASGHEELAKKISSESNYEYIENMHYPELVAWANEFGFKDDELKWIQPSYGCASGACAADTKRDISCKGMYDGCIGLPATSLTHPPFMYEWFMYYTPMGQWDLIWQNCDLGAGEYKCRITDSIGNTEEKFFTLTEPDSISLSKTVTGDGGGCDGSALISATGGTAPFNYMWQHISGNNPYITGLCHGTYYVSVVDSRYCMRNDSVMVDFTAGIPENVNDYFSVQTDGATGRLVIKSNVPGQIFQIALYSIGGSLIYSDKAFRDSDAIDISSMSEGMYVLNVADNNQSLNYKFIKGH
jgi:hypothetical protein